MAEIVLGIATSHSPMLTLDGADWHNRAAADRANKELSLADGRLVDYETLVAQRGEAFADVAVSEEFERIAARCQGHLDRLAAAIAAVQPDVVVVVGDDQDELYAPGNMPAIALYWGDEIVTHSFDDEIPAWMRTVAKGYGMDEMHVYAGHAAFGRELIEALIDQDVDLAIANSVPDPAPASAGAGRNGRPANSTRPPCRTRSTRWRYPAPSSASARSPSGGGSPAACVR